MSEPANRPGRLGIGVIGAGKVGAVLGAALRSAGHALVGVHAVSEDSRTRAEALLPDVPVLPIPQIVERSEVVLFAVPDDELGPLVSGLAQAGHFTTGQILVHTSGRFGTDVLEPGREAGAIALAVHPVMTFTGLSLDLARLHTVSFGVTASGPFLPIAQALVVEMGGEPVVVAEGDRPLYHAALAHASNHSVTLVGQASQILESMGIENPGEVLGPLVRASIDNALASGDGALTGPVVRGDAGTVQTHRENLEGFATEESAPDIGAAYLAMAEASAYRANRRGALPDEALERILRALGLENSHKSESGGHEQ